MAKEFKVECNVCGTRYYNWVGSTPCCGSIAYLVDDDDNKTNDICLFASIGNDEINPTIIKLDQK
jgi:hypothetical protein